MKKSQTVYFSKHLKNSLPVFYKNIEMLILEQGYNVCLLEHTKDIWVRDFMPLVYGDTYLEYRYDPDYLKNDIEYKTEPNDPIAELGLETKKIDLVLDGGNLVSYEDIVIMTDKVFKENIGLTMKMLYQKLPFFKKIIILPHHKDDPFGHADGMVRFIDKEHLLVNSDYENDFKNELHTILHKNSFKITELKLKEHTENSWGYINFLEVGDLIVQPSINKINDIYVKEQLENAFLDRKVILCDANPLLKSKNSGGVFNCISWSN